MPKREGLPWVIIHTLSRLRPHLPCSTPFVHRHVESVADGVRCRLHLQAGGHVQGRGTGEGPHARVHGASWRASTSAATTHPVSRTLLHISTPRDPPPFSFPSHSPSFPCLSRCWRIVPTASCCTACHVRVLRACRINCGACMLFALLAFDRRVAPSPAPPCCLP